MSIQASASLSVQLPSAPAYSVAWVIQADAYDRASVTVAKTKTGTLELQPGKATEVLLLAITSSDYTGTVKYGFGGTAWPLNGPQIFPGLGLSNAISAGGGGPNQLVIDNTAGTADVKVDVLVVRTGLS
ncbi:MAG TPA: hypothetical protein VH639_08775 [Bryobacteraceae bacterium]|jgi:hypothetical protein